MGMILIRLVTQTCYSTLVEHDTVHNVTWQVNLELLNTQEKKLLLNPEHIRVTAGYDEWCRDGGGLEDNSGGGQG